MTNQKLAAAEARLRAALEGSPRASVLSGAAATAPYARDRSGHVPAPAEFIVVLAGSVADVQAVCRVSHELGVPIVTRGAGTGYAGGAVAGEGSIVLSLERLTGIRNIDVLSERIEVEPGVITAQISEAVREHGLRYAPDPASAETCTIGGNIATNAGGLCCVKYGVTRDNVLALDVVLGTGELISVGHRSIKGVSGYDLTGLMVGSEGTLGIVVGATLRLLPLPLGEVHTVAAWFETTPDAAQASAELFATRVRPSMLELVDGAHLERIDAWRGTTFRSQGGALLLAQTDGLAAAAEAELIAGALRARGAAVEVTADPGRADELLEIRRWTSQDSPVRAELTVNEDIAVPREKLVATVELIEEIRREHGVVITILAHIGDGNLHANIRVPLEELGPGGALPPNVVAAADAMIAGALALGGTITGEHGIGLMKRAWLPAELGEPQYALQRAVKALFDPQNLLNPGKVFVEQGSENPVE